MVFDAFRTLPFPALYGPLKSAVTADVLEAGFLYATLIVAVSIIVVIPGLRGKEGIYAILRCFVAIFITASIMLCNFGQEWEVAHITTKTQYKAGLRKEIKADIGVKIGLRSVNITLKTDPVVQEFDKMNETINYNERFSWDNQGWTQGRNGFGPFAGKVNQEFRAAQYKGLPYPILWIAEYFTIDGEGIRWGRHYRQAGFFCHILLWTAFPLWILSIIFFHIVLRYGTYFMMLTGATMLLTNIIYASIRNRNQLVIPFEDENLEFSWGGHFWLCLITGIICVVLGLVVFIMDLRFKEYVSSFFAVDVLQDYEEYYASHDELLQQGVHIDAIPGVKPTRSAVENGGTGARGNEQDSRDDDDVYENPEVVQRMFRRKGTKNPVRSGTSGEGLPDRVSYAISKAQKSRKNKPRAYQTQESRGPPQIQSQTSHDNQAFDGKAEDGDHPYENYNIGRIASIFPPPRPPKKPSPPDRAHDNDAPPPEIGPSIEEEEAL